MMDLRELFSIIAATLLLVIGVAVPVLGVAYLATNYQCNQYGVATGKPTKFTGGSCYISENGHWYAWEEYKHRFVAKGELK